MSARGVEVHATCAIQFVVGAPQFIWQSGEFSATITDNGAGDVTLTFNAANGVDATEVAWDGQAIDNAAAARVTIAFEPLTATTTRVRLYDQVGAGLADIGFYAIAYRRVII